MWNPLRCPSLAEDREDKVFTSPRNRKLRMRWESGEAVFRKPSLHDLKDWPFDFFCFVF